MIGIQSVASYIPPNHESNLSRKAEFGIDDEFVFNKLGVEHVSRKLPEEETSDLCVEAFASLQKKTLVRPSEIDCIVVCTQNPDGSGIPHTSAVVQGKLNVPDECACFDISLGCSGYVYALSVIKSFMESNGMKTGLLFTADPYSKIIDPNDKNTVLLFGDAASVTLMRDSTESPGLWMPNKFSFATRGREGDALHNRGKYLFMNGRAIFDFSVTQVPLQVNGLLHAAGLTCSDVDLFLFHQGSKFIVDQLRKRMRLPESKVPVKLAKHGNTVSTSIPLVLEDCMAMQDVRNILMCGFGVGLSWASCLLNRQD